MVPYRQHERYCQLDLDTNAAATLGRLEMVAVRPGHGRQFRVTDASCHWDRHKFF